MPNLKQNQDGSLGIQGDTKDDGGFIPVSFYWNVPNADTAFFIADRPYVVKAIRSRVDTAGTDVGAVTGAIKKAPSATAIASGTALHSGTIDLKGTAATNQAITLSTTASTLKIAAGDAIGFDLTGTATAAVGCVTVFLAPA